LGEKKGFKKMYFPKTGLGAFGYNRKTKNSGKPSRISRIKIKPKTKFSAKIRIFFHAPSEMHRNNSYLLTSAFSILSGVQ